MNILLIDDEADHFAPTLEAALGGACVVPAMGSKAGLDAAGAGTTYDLILLDMNMPAEVGDDPGREGLAVLRVLRDARPDLPVVVLTVQAEVDLVVEAMRLGAFYYLTKPPDLAKLRMVVGEAAQAARRGPGRGEAPAKGRCVKRAGAPARFGALVGGSPAQRKVYESIERVAPCDLAVLILGASGTGKELVAREVHARSGRSKGPFRPINCAAIPSNLLESRLFGHKKGAFTGADRDLDGEFAMARGGTLFLDEIGDMSPELQAKLLRVLDDGMVLPLGARDAFRSDARIVAATNRDLVERIRDGRFREDLFFRLNVVPIHLAPLCERREDIPFLAQALLDRACGSMGRPPRRIAPEAVERLKLYSWPGNVREMENCLKRALALTDGEMIGPEDVRPESVCPAPAGAVPKALADDVWRRIEAEGNDCTDLAEFRNRHGEGVLREVIERALRREKQVRRAGVFLGFVVGPDDGAGYDRFRQWLTRLGVSARKVVG